MPLTTTTPKPIIFTDLDGTLLDRDTYSFEPILPALRMIREREIPLVLSSSKTRAEIELYRRRIENEHPFIIENGGAVFIPKGYFSFSFPYDRALEEYFVLELGVFYPVLVETLEAIRKETGVKMRGFSDLTREELASLAGLPPQEAELAKRREFDEPFVLEGEDGEVEIVKRKIEEKGMNYVRGGRFHHLLGKNDKGKAVEILKELYENQFFSIFTIGIGDNLNDIPMLSAVDRAIFLKDEKVFSPESLAPIQNLTLIDGIGPRAWREAMLIIFSELRD